MTLDEYVAWVAGLGANQPAGVLKTARSSRSASVRQRDR